MTYLEKKVNIFIKNSGINDILSNYSQKYTFTHLYTFVTLLILAVNSVTVSQEEDKRDVLATCPTKVVVY